LTGDITDALVVALCASERAVKPDMSG
jgi:hypothetical protein